MHPVVEVLHGGGRNDPTNAVADHKVDAAWATAHQGLPHLHGSPQRSWHQSDVAQLITTIRDLWWECVVFALMGEGLFVKRLEDNFYLLLEQFTVGFDVLHGRVEGLDLTGVVATADAED